MKTIELSYEETMIMKTFADFSTDCIGNTDAMSDLLKLVCLYSQHKGLSVQEATQELLQSGELEIDLHDRLIYVYVNGVLCCSKNY